MLKIIKNTPLRKARENMNSLPRILSIAGQQRETTTVEGHARCFKTRLLRPHWIHVNEKITMNIANMQSHLAHSPAMVGRPLARRGCLSSLRCLSHRHALSPGGTAKASLLPKGRYDRKMSMSIVNQAFDNGQV